MAKLEMGKLMFRGSRFRFAAIAVTAALVILTGCGGGNSGSGGGIVDPPAPTGLIATAGNAQVSLSWTASSGATSYHVKRSTTTDSGYTQVGAPTTASYTDTGLTNGIQYFYVVSAVNSAGESANSAQVNATPAAPAANLPGPSAALFASPMYTCVNNYYVATNGSDSNPG